MNIAEFFIKKNVITLVFAFLLLLLGVQAFNNMSRLEDPEFTIKTAVIATPYPGATAEEVEQEVTNQIEQAVQELGQLWYVESVSSPELSIVKAYIKENFSKNKLPQVWNELRRKVSDYERKLPPGAGPSFVNDDFGDVYGMFFAIGGEGYSYKEIKDFADLIKKELLLVENVKRIEFLGEQLEVIYVEMKRQKMAQLGISQNEIYQALSDKNLVVESGKINLGREYISINPSGKFSSEKQFGDLLISKLGSDKLIYLRDVATVRRDYIDPSSQLLFVNGHKAIGLGISTVEGGDVVKMGKALEKRIKELIPLAPLGMEVKPIYIQSKNVDQAIRSFMVNLIEAIVIVIGVLLLFMGLQSGLIIGFVLLLTICGTFVFMDFNNIILQRVSLGALIIALGMLVDNAIVVVEGMKVKIETGEDPLKAAKEVVGQTAMPLLGGTAVAIVAFASIGVSQDVVGEFCRSLFQVILISLSISWVTAVTITPLLCKMFIKKKQGDQGQTKDPYAGKMFRVYKKFLIKCLQFRFITITVVIGLFFVSFFGFRFVKPSFFPSSTTPQLLVDVWMPEGTHINSTLEELKKSEKFLMSIDGVTDVALTVGGPYLRFMLTYGAELPSDSYGQFILTFDNYKKIEKAIPAIESKLAEIYLDATVGVKQIRLGPGDGGAIQLRIMGPDANVLRVLAKKAKDIIYEDGGAKTIRDEWREKVKIVRPQMLEMQSRRMGITRAQIASTLEAAYSGKRTGIYKEGINMIPIVSRSPEEERMGVESMKDLLIWSPVAGKMIPFNEVISGFKTEFEDVKIWRRNRVRMLRVHADVKEGLPSELLTRIKPKIEKALNVDVEMQLGKEPKKGEDPYANFDDKTLPIIYGDQMPLKGMPGYSLGWDGEAEDQSKANAGIAKSLPLFAGIMVVIVICLFNAFKQPAIIWLTVPLALIGVTFGLLLTGASFGFMCLLGLISLSGMLIKNAVVLINQIDLEIRGGKAPYNAIVDSGVSRIRPVAMAAITTILGMAPLLADAFFMDMAVTIMFGLGFATLLTLIFVPVIYAVFFKVKIPT